MSDCFFGGAGNLKAPGFNVDIELANGGAAALSTNILLARLTEVPQ